MKTLFRPAIKLMNNLTFPKKFLLIGAIALTIYVFLFYSFTKESLDKINFSSKERTGIEYNEPVKHLISLLINYRDLTVKQSLFDKALTDKLTATKQEIEQAFKAIDTVERKYASTLNTTEKLQSIKSQWARLNSQNHNLKQTLTLQNEIINSTIDLISHVGDTSNLILDPDLDSFYLMDAIITKLLPLADTLAQVANLSLQLIAKNSITPDEKIELIVLIGNAKQLLQANNKGMAVSFGQNKDVKSALEATLTITNEDVNKFIAYTESQIALGQLDKSKLQDYLALSTTAVSSLLKLYDKTSPMLDALLHKRLAGFKLRMNLVLIIGITCLALALYLAGGTYWSIKEAVDNIKEASQAVSEGNLSVRAKHLSQDELGIIADSFNSMLSSMSSVINQILITSANISQAIEDIEKKALLTQQEANKITSQSQSVATAAEEMNQTISDIAQNSSRLTETSNAAMTIATKGRDISKSAVEGMQKMHRSILQLADMIDTLNSKALEINEIVSVIKDIADQTNLLALNAAIEAARAGEQGRGFAVVADEVRKLAEKTIKATTDVNEKISSVQAESVKTKQSMGTATSEVTETAELIQQVGSSLDNILASVSELKNQFAHIASAIEQQSIATDEVTSNITKVTESAKDIEEMSSSLKNQISSLSKSSVELIDKANRFKL